MKRIRINTISVYVSTTLVLTLIGTMGLLLLTADSLSNHIRKNMTVTIILDNDASEQDALKLKNLLYKKVYSAGVHYISKEQALEEQKHELGADPTEFLGFNPFEASLELSLNPQYANNDSIAKIEKALSKHDCIAEITYNKDLMGSINSNIHKISIGLLALSAMMAIISWSLISNMVRLSIYSKRFLLHTMKLIGATWGFIRRPFLIQNMWIGLLSGILANMLLGTALYIIFVNEPAAAEILPAHRLVALGAGIIAFGIMITVSCAYLSVNRFLRMRSNDLYFI